MKDKKFLSIHAHFYQPPRENPWLGEIDFQDSAAHYDNWNHKIAMESYFPNLFGRIKNYKGEILEIVNNYEYLNFNFGPTLLEWIERKYPHYYQILVKNVKEIKEKNGFSNIIAQSYNHTILPLDNFQDKLTQIYWGIKDFELRFGFYPTGMWLPETAVNEDVLRLLIDKGIKYVILAPYQVTNPVNIKTRERVVRIENNANYIWFDRDENNDKIKNRFINIFIYNGELSKKIAFDNILIDSSTFCDTINSHYLSGIDKPQLIIIATDGETYGHHHKFGDMTLSHSFKHELKKKNIQIISLEEYLSLYPSEYEIELAKGPDEDGTSWSCSHGLRRWKGGCPCGDEGKYNTNWRLPLRNAVEWLREVLSDIYKEEGKNLFPDIWKARNEYIFYLKNKKQESFEIFLKENAFNLNNEQKEKAIKLLEMQKYSMLMFTSCAWFFNDISRIETQQNMKYAYRAIEISESFGFKGIDKIFSSILQMAKSNFKEMENGKYVYENYVKNSIVSYKQISCYITYKSFLYKKDKYSNSRYELEIYEKIIQDNFFIFKVSLIDREILKKENFIVFLNFKNNSLPEFYIIENSDDNIPLYISEIEKAKKIDIKSYPQSIQKDIISLTLCKLKKENLSKFRELINIYINLIESEPEIILDNFSNIIEEIKFYVSGIFTEDLKELIILKNKEKINELKLLCEKLNKIKLKPEIKNKNEIINILPEFTELLFSNYFNENEIKILTNIFSTIDLSEFTFHIENYNFIT